MKKYKYKVVYIQPYIDEVVLSDANNKLKKEWKLYKVIPVFGTGMMMHRIKGLVLIYRKEK